MNQCRTVRWGQVQKSRWQLLFHCTQYNPCTKWEGSYLCSSLRQNSHPPKMEGFLEQGEKTRVLTHGWWAVHRLHPNSQLSTNIYIAWGYRYSLNILAQILDHNPASLNWHSPVGFSGIAVIYNSWGSHSYFFLGASDGICSAYFFQLKTGLILK